MAWPKPDVGAGFDKSTLAEAESEPAAMGGTVLYANAIDAALLVPRTGDTQPS